jgi:hypothetical protein
MNYEQAVNELSKDYPVKALKNFPGHDGVIHGGNLYKGNKKIAEIAQDSADAGIINVHIINHDAYEEFIGKIKELPHDKYPESIGIEGTITPDEEYVLGSLLDISLINKEYKKYCKNATVFTLKSDAPGEFRSIKGKYSEQYKNIIEKKYGDDLKEIVNERFK